MTPKAPKPRKCKNKLCGKMFTPSKPLQSVCDFGCAIELNLQNKAKKARKEHREAKEKAKSRADWMKEAQIAWNAYRRTEDGIERGGKCISCGTTSGKQNCGHYRSVGSTPALRFERLNTWLQCERCNTYLHSNAIEFRLALSKILTPNQLDWLDGPHEPRKYTIEELKDIRDTSRKKLRELKSE